MNVNAALPVIAAVLALLLPDDKPVAAQRA
jgi:hypothetical protein